MNSLKSIIQSAAWLLALATPGLALSQAEIEIRMVASVVTLDSVRVVESSETRRAWLEEFDGRKHRRIAGRILDSAQIARR